jgi:dimeric dUTPase (all-alpha-NTP-PPase superfamily)
LKNVREMIREMYELQNKLNINTNGADWTKGITSEGREINWHRCIFMEASEAIDSLNWKHWKNIDMKNDIDNLEIEVVDFWHFIMSARIEEVGIDKAIDEAIEMAHSIKKTDWNTNIILALEAVIKTSIDYKTPLSEFFKVLLEMEDFKMEDVYALYIGKNCLNQFRQDNGYKDGSYEKMWNGKEDNVYMMKCVRELEDLSYDNVYAILEVEYKKVA